MRRTSAGIIAAGAAAVTLGLLVMACNERALPLPGDGSTLADLAVPDLSSAAVDLAAPDLMPPPLFGEAFLADVVGTGYSAAGAAGETPVPFVHSFLHFATFPEPDRKSDFSDIAVDASLGHISGCRANRWTPGTADSPPADAQAGAVTMTGYNTRRMAPKSSGFASLIPGTITCTNPGGVAPYYGCNFSGPPAANSVAGAVVNTVFFVALPEAASTMFRIPNWPGWPAACAASGGGCGAADCDTSRGLVSLPGPVPLCEQILFNLDGSSRATITTAGDNTFGALTSADIPVPGPARIYSIQVGGVEVSSPTTASLVDLENKIGPSQEVVITWSCSATNAPGAGCTGGLFGPHVVVAGVTSLMRRASFTTPSATFGFLECFSPASTGILTIQANAIAEMLGKPTPQTVGSLWMALVHAGLETSLTNPSYDQSKTWQLNGAGSGTFAMMNFR